MVVALRVPKLCVFVYLAAACQYPSAVVAAQYAAPELLKVYMWMCIYVYRHSWAALLMTLHCPTLD